MFLDYEILVTDLTREDAGRITPLQREKAIAAAVERYSQDRPRDKVEDINGQGTQALALPAGWQADFSVLRSLEYPVGNVPPTVLAQDSYGLYLAPAGQSIQLRAVIPIGVANVRATYTIRHQVGAAVDTIPQQHREVVACWATAILCDQLASFYSGQTDTTMQADAVDHKSKAGEYAARARGFRKRYLDELGIDVRRNVAAGAVVNLDRMDSRGEDRLFKQSRYR